MATSALRINMTGFNGAAETEAERYQAALAMARFADQAGFTAVNVEEHHAADNGWLGSPLTMAAAIAGQTEHCAVGICALLITLYDPVRLAEDLAVVDNLSGGRLYFIAGQGYRPLEYHAMDKDWGARGKGMDHCIETLLKAWTGEPFDYKGQTIRVSPKPLASPQQMMLIGGMGKNAARRAARFGLNFYPPAKMPELEKHYYQAQADFGTQGEVLDPGAGSSIWFIDPNPEQAWQELGHHFLQESQEYASWKMEGLERPLESSVDDIESLRAQGLYEILSPEQAHNRLQQNPATQAVLHPLIGGMPLDRAWQCLKLYAEHCLPQKEDVAVN